MSALNLEIASGPADGVYYEGGLFPTSNSAQIGDLGGSDVSMWALFIDSTYLHWLNVSSIESATYRFYVNSHNGSPVTRIKMGLEETPTVPATLLEFATNPRTTAYVDYTESTHGWVEVDVTSLLVEVLGSYSPTQSLMVYHENNGSTSGDYLEVYHWNQPPTGTLSPELSITYSRPANLLLLGVS